MCICSAAYDNDYQKYDSQIFHFNGFESEIERKKNNLLNRYLIFFLHSKTNS